MPQRNRVTPLSELVVDEARGLVYGNRGCLHDDEGAIVRFSATRRWIACRLEFRDYRRPATPLPGRYTGLYFLDEATAFAAGHRPCAFCRRADFNLLKARWGGADAIDARLDAERMDGSARRLHATGDPPDGAFVLLGDAPHLVLSDALRPWSPGGYGPPTARPGGRARMITPPSLAELLHDGWSGAVPLLHPSATE